MNMVNFYNKKALVRPNEIDKGKGKEIIIGDPQEANENAKISCRKVVVEKTPDGGETLKITITASSVGGRCRQPAKYDTLFYALRTVRRESTDDLRHYRTV
jgi:hypothetical protein